MRAIARLISRTALLGAILLWLPAAVSAQEAAMSGTVTDSTGAVLPGVTITAIHEASGNTFEAVTDERGTYRIPLRIGAYRVTAALSGFATVTRTGLEVLVGQQAVINLQLAPSALQESVTVTAEAPLVDVSQSRASGNVDSRQMQELPVNGRNWQDLALLAPGVAREFGRAGGGVGQRHAGQLSRQPGRPAGDAEYGGRARSVRAAAVQPRCHRRIRVRRQPVRRDAGAVGGGAGQCDHEVGHERVRGGRLRLLPARSVQGGGLHPAARAAVLGPAGTASPSVARSCATSLTSSSTTSTSASRRRSRPTACIRRSTSI